MIEIWAKCNLPCLPYKNSLLKVPSNYWCWNCAFPFAWQQQPHQWRAIKHTRYVVLRKDMTMWGIHLGRQLKLKSSYWRLPSCLGVVKHGIGIQLLTGLDFMFYMNIMKLYDLAEPQSTFNQHRTKTLIAVCQKREGNLNVCVCNEPFMQIIRNLSSAKCHEKVSFRK